MVSVGISKLGCTDLVFVDSGIKNNGAYYCQNSYSPWCARYQGNFSSFNRTMPQHTSTRHCATSWAMPAFIPPDLWPANSPNLNPVDYRIWSVIQQRVYQLRVHDTDELKQCVQQMWRNVDQSITDNALTSGTNVFVHACRQKVDTSSICCKTICLSPVNCMTTQTFHFCQIRHAFWFFLL